MIFVTAIVAFLFFGWAAPNAARAMIPRETPVSIVAARMGGPNAIVQRTRGRLYLPKADEEPTRDAAGRVTLDSRWEYTWNLRGELLRAESKHRSPNVRLDYAYYPSGPMARRELREEVNGQFEIVSTTRWIVDGWRPVKEIETREGGDTIERLYTWGLDLAGWRDRRSLEESGGIGGLLAVRERVNGGEWATYYVLADPMGNVMALATADGTLVAEYDYDPYGRLIRETGAKAASCPFRYSTKYRDPELDLYYYGHRWYDAAGLKWLTPDPIGERGGANLTAFCDGDPINKVDPLGLETEIVAMLRFRYGFEFLARHKNLRPQIRLDVGIGARTDVGVNATPQVEAMASMLIGGPRTSAVETSAIWDLNLFAGVALHKGRSDIELPSRITGVTPIFMNDYEESVTTTLALNYNTGLRLRTTAADISFRSGETMVGIYNDVFFGTDQGPTGGGYYRRGRTMIAHDVFTGPRVTGDRDPLDRRFYRQSPSEIVYNRSVTTIEYGPDERYGLAGASFQTYDSCGLVIHPLHVLVNALDRIVSKLLKKDHDPDKDSLFFHFDNNEGFNIMLWPEFYDGRRAVRP